MLKYLSVILSVLCMSFICPQMVDARPPSDILVDYNSEESVLYVEIKHVSYRKRDHFIRKLMITKNEENAKVFRYTYQKKPNGLIQDVPLLCESGDVIHIEVSCTKTGKKKIKYIIP